MFFSEMGLYDAAGKDDREEVWPAYMTVEASFLVSFTVILFVVVIYMAFYQYDRCVLAQDLYLLCFRESLLREEENRTAGQEELARRQFGKKYFMTDRIGAEMETENDLIRYSAEASFQNRVFRGSALMPGENWKLCASSSARKTDPPFHIRRFRRVRALLRKASGAGGKHDGI